MGWKQNSQIKFGMRWIYLTCSNTCTHQANKGPLSKLVQGHEPNNFHLKCWMCDYDFNCSTTHKDEFPNKVGINVTFYYIKGERWLTAENYVWG